MISKRKARELALRVLYEAEIGKGRLEDILTQAQQEANLPAVQEDYADRLVRGVWQGRREIDGRVGPLIREYDYSRIAAVDRNVLRIAAYELYEEPAIPPAVTINEAIEIAKKFSTAESGRFVNGVLGRLLQDSPKAHWDPQSAPAEEREELVHEPEPEVETEVVPEDAEEAKQARRFGWVLRSED